VDETPVAQMVALPMAVDPTEERPTQEDIPTVVDTMLVTNMMQVVTVTLVAKIATQEMVSMQVVKLTRVANRAKTVVQALMRA
jgi:hypothetical protein